MTNNNLNDQQKRFTLLDSDRIRLLAPAGSGKTLALLHRCLELHRKDKNCEFLLFSYTRAAVMELRSRIANDSLFAPIRDAMEVKTINSWGNGYVKKEIPDIQNIRLLSDATQRRFAVLNFLQPIWQQIQYKKFAELLNDNRKKWGTSRRLLELIDLTKTLGVCVDEFSKKDDNYIAVWRKYRAWFENIGIKTFIDRGDYTETLQKLELHKRHGYRNNEDDAFALNFLPFFCDSVDHLRKSGVITFEDQKYLPYLDLRQKNINGEKTKRKKKLHMFVDEFQDANPLDLQLMVELRKFENADLVLVGDDDQAIYQFRGATPEFILSPESFWGNGFETVIFETNYRSPSNIISTSQQLIKHNTKRLDKNVKTNSTNHVDIIFIDENNEDSLVYNDVDQHVLDNIKNGRTCALVGRKKGQLLPYQILFARQGTPFYVDMDLNIFESEAYQNLVDILTVKAEGLSLRWQDRVMKVIDQMLRFPLNKDRRQALRQTLTSKDTIQENLNLFANKYKIFNRLGETNKIFGGAKAKKYEKRGLGDIFVYWLNEPSVAQTLDTMATLFHGFRQDFGKAEEDVFYTEPPFSHLIDFARLYKNDFEHFLEDLEKVRTHGKEYKNGESFDASIKIVIATAFRTKGREFDTVYILDANTNYWPSTQAKTDEELEAERRLFYVAVTRTKKVLVFTNAGDHPTQYLSEMGVK